MSRQTGDRAPGLVALRFIARRLPRTSPHCLTKAIAIVLESNTIYYVTRNNDPALLVLASLAEGDKHGYAMMEDIERFSSVRLGPGTLYGAITRLEESGWIAAVPSEDRRQPYTLTALGRKSLENEIAALNDLVKTASKRLRHA